MVTPHVKENQGKIAYVEAGVAVHKRAMRAVRQERVWASMHPCNLFVCRHGEANRLDYSAA